MNIDKIKHLPIVLGSSILRMQSYSRFEAINLTYTVQNASNEIISVQQALMSPELNSIRCFVLQIHSSVTYNNHGTSRTSTFILIGDQSGTAYLAATDLKQDKIKPEKSYTITNIRKKVFNGSFILSTTIDTDIQLSDVVN